MLILFDIDATLLVTGGVGIRAMDEAGTALFGPACNAGGVSVAGRLDPLIMRDMLAKVGKPASRENLAAFRAAYEDRMRHHFAQTGEGRVQSRALPGVHELVNALDGRDAITLGVLTGNFASTGSMKLRSVDLNPERFPICAWGDESPHDPPERAHLPPVATKRYRDKHDRDPSRVLIIGDTPHDVHCAKVHGHACLGVGTGQFSAADLKTSGADHSVDDLSDTHSVLKFIDSLR
ncbi:MAG TPA: HAD hydrolase-like protein [Phycisphaerales bacterium]